MAKKIASGANHLLLDIPVGPTLKIKHFKDAEIIAKKFEIPEIEFITLATEGYLFPDKYLMPSQATTDYIIRTLVRTFKEKTGEVSYKQVIIASMLEREGLSDSDRPLISDVISKRLNRS